MRAEGSSDDSMYPIVDLPIGSLVVPFGGLPYRILDINRTHKKEPLRSLWVECTSACHGILYKCWRGLLLRVRP